MTDRAERGRLTYERDFQTHSTWTGQVTAQDEERSLHGDKDHPEAILVPDNEREWSEWLPGYRSRNQPQNLRFIPLYEVRDEHYAIYFPIQEPR